MEDSTPLKKTVYDLFVKSAVATERRRLAGRPPTLLQRLLRPLGELLVMGPVKDQLGMSRLRNALTGGEAIGEDTFVFYRALWLEEESDSFAFTGVRDPAGTNGSFAGHQVEARVRYWILPRILRLELGGAVLFNGGFLENASNASGNGDTAYGYADITFTF